MKITIDTTSDSKEEIRKAIKMLISLVGAGDIYTNEPEQREIDTTPEVTNAMSMFDNVEKTERTEGTEEKSDEKELPQLEFY